MNINLAEHLVLKRPLVAFDTETTGVGDEDRIVQISLSLHRPLGDPPIRFSTLVNPEMPIPPAATAVHGITNEMVADAPKWRDVMGRVVGMLLGADYTGHSVRFDLERVRYECSRNEHPWDWEKTDAVVICTLRVQQTVRPNDLKSLYKEATGEDLEGAHDASADVGAAEVVLVDQLTKNLWLPRTVPELAARCRRLDWVDSTGKIVWVLGEACVGFGKKAKGVPLRLVDRGFLNWIIRENFPADTKKICLDALNGVFPIAPLEPIGED